MRELLEYDASVAADGRAAARLFGIPYTVLKAWQVDGFVGRKMITPEQWSTLDMIRCVVWENRRVIRAMLANLPRSERRRLVDVCKKTAIERIVYCDFLRYRLTGQGIMNDCRLVTYDRYSRYLRWRHENLHHLLTSKIFIAQRKSAEARIRAARRRGELDRLVSDLGLRLEDGRIVNPWIKPMPKEEANQVIDYND